MKKILGLTIAMVAILATVVIGTLAYFSDTETSADNVFTAGTLDLKISNDASTYTDGVTATFNNTSLKPGDTVSGTVTLKNDGTIAANHVEMKFTYVNTEATTPAEILGAASEVLDMATVLEITTATYGGVDIIDDLKTLIGGSPTKIYLSDLSGLTFSTTDVPTPSGAATKALALTFTIDSAVGNGIQGDTITLTITFGLFQDASQHLP